MSVVVWSVTFQLWVNEQDILVKLNITHSLSLFCVCARLRNARWQGWAVHQQTRVQPAKIFMGVSDQSASSAAEMEICTYIRRNCWSLGFVVKKSNHLVYKFHIVLHPSICPSIYLFNYFTYSLENLAKEVTEHHKGSVKNKVWTKSEEDEGDQS